MHSEHENPCTIVMEFMIQDSLIVGLQIFSFMMKMENYINDR